jgi:hypothetical protein
MFLPALKRNLCHKPGLFFGATSNRAVGKVILLMGETALLMGAVIFPAEKSFCSREKSFFRRGSRFANGRSRFSGGKVTRQICRMAGLASKTKQNGIFTAGTGLKWMETQ